MTHPTPHTPDELDDLIIQEKLQVALELQHDAWAESTADGIEPEIIDADQSGRLLRRLKWRHRSEVVLVVGHSNTVPLIADGLGAEIGVVDAEDYSGLWIISYSRLRGTRLLTLRY